MDQKIAKSIARGAKKHGYNSITTKSIQDSEGINTIIFEPTRVQPRSILME